MIVIHAHGAACPLLRMRRLRTRRVQELSVVETVADRYAAGDPLPVVAATHGGTVSSGYSWRCETESVVVVLVEPEVAVLFGGRLPACHATLAGAAVAATGLGDIRCLYDGRYTQSARKQRARRALARAADAAVVRFKLTGA